MKPHGTKTDGITPWLFLAPSLIFVTVVVLIPFADVVRRSFFSAMGKEFVGLRNYRLVLDNEAFRLAAFNTVKFAAVCIPIFLAASLILALALNAARENHGIFKTTFLVPFAIPVASMVLLWRVVFHENGLLNVVLEKIGLAPINWLWSGSAFYVLVFTYLWKNAGYSMVLWLSGLTGINPALYEAASIDGAGAWKRFTKITMPCLTPTMFMVTVLSLLNSLKVFREAYLIAGSYPNESIYMLQHLFNNWFVSLDVDKMTAGAVLMAVVVLILILLLQATWGKDVSE